MDIQRERGYEHLWMGRKEIKRQMGGYIKE